MTPPTIPHYSEQMGRIYVLAMEEILGPQECRDLLASAGLSGIGGDHSEPAGISFPNIARINYILMEIFGWPAGKGLSLRMGRAAFRYAVRAFATEFGLDTLEYRLLPLQKKVKSGLEILVRLFECHTDQGVRLAWTEEHISWQMQPCPFCWQVDNAEGWEKEAACDWMVGFLQEALTWMSGGKCYQVREENCIADGSSLCTIRIDRNPIG